MGVQCLFQALLNGGKNTLGIIAGDVMTQSPQVIAIVAVRLAGPPGTYTFKQTPHCVLIGRIPHACRKIS